MIKDIADLLKQFFEFEKKKIAEFDMPHMPTLGEAYEEITKQGISQKYILPDLHGLKVVSGFVKIGDKLLPQQIDCMLVHGDGEKYGLTETYIYEIKNVLAIFEIKKKLTKNSLQEALVHLSEIKIHMYGYIDEILNTEDFEEYFNHFSLHFSYLIGYRFEKFSDLKKLLQEDFKIGQALLTEMIMPVTIVHAHEGYKTISGLRSALQNIVQEIHDTNPSRGFRIFDLPTLITTTDGGILKTTGLPYWCTIHRDTNAWGYMCSFTENPARVIIEKLWAKIGIVLNIEFPYGDDLEKENLFPFFEIRKQRSGAWEGLFVDYSNEDFQEFKKPISDFSPINVNAEYIDSINLIGFMGGVPNIDEYKDHLRSKSIDVDNFFDQLRVLPFIGLRDKTINITSSWLSAKVGDNFYVSSELDRFHSWLKKQPEEYKILSRNILAI